MKMYDLLKEFIRPELLLIVPGMALKASALNDKFIPWILGGAGVILCAAYLFGTSTLHGWQETLLAIFTAVTQGILLARASVYVNQLAKQSKK